MALCFSSADIVVLPSIEDNSPNIIIESFACGRPVVAFDVGGIGDWLKDSETGYLVKAGDFDQMRSRIEFLLMNPKKARTMGVKAREHVENHFSAESHVAGLMRIFNSVRDHQPKSLS